MTDPTPSERAARRRLINLGEGVAVAALIISALGLWNSWRGDNYERWLRAQCAAFDESRSIAVLNAND